MNDREQLARALAMVEAAVQDMADAGLNPHQRAVALAFHMKRQVDLWASTPGAAAAIKVSLATG
jgi:hypothetical protein